MRLISSTIFVILLVSCSSKYKGLHTDKKKFTQDVHSCLKVACTKPDKSFLNDFFIFSSAHAYGGGGIGGNGSSLDDKISYKNFYICLEEKGYTEDENGTFELPYLACGIN